MGTPTFGEIIVVGLYTETPLHCGAESAVGYVDLPVQRERHTSFPVIPGSTIKGVLKDEPTSWDKTRVFGKTDCAGQVSFGDGILVAFPVRSSHHPFHWVTCPLALGRLFRAVAKVITAVDPGGGKAWARADGRVLLEEIAVTKVAKPSLFSADQGELRVLLDLLPASSGFAYIRSVFLDRLLVASDDDFRELVGTGTEVLTRIKLNAHGTTTTIKEPDIRERIRQELRAKLNQEPSDGELREAWEGNIFVEEVVPPDTVFFTTFRSNTAGLLETGKLPPLVRLGGDETIGRGLTYLTVAGGK